MARNQRGVPPVHAMSLAFTWTAYRPILLVANVMGSLLATSNFSLGSNTAASSPVLGPKITRWSNISFFWSSFSSNLGGNLPISNVSP